MGMARFYMNLRYRDRLFVDECGDELADEHAVWCGCSGKAQAEPAGLSCQAASLLGWR